ncbi:metallophosphoesterase family protein [Actomonas aquatica]|uniref:Phosphoesterase n=1 Tax=Actomonas aquatica TaxID=2866162 RepID=A0ABZ1C4J1_9BACT|nr:metallophosphoesterase family protein [Opitutus sp. WL0086]WRQ86371.1 metallophosphoesterase family protein [Opitutus sp. WL0086]
MRIAVLSDTHDHMPSRLPEQIAAGRPDAIWHLGDVCDPSTVVELELLNVPLSIVAGNCDGWMGWPLTREISLGGYVFHLEHIPRVVAPRGVQVMLHGHTHVPRDQTDPMGVRWLNPGSASSPRYEGPPSFGWLTVDAEAERVPLSWELVPLK